MRSMMSRLLDIRMLWFLMPLWGNLIFLPMLLSALVINPTGKLHRVVQIHIVLGIIFFTYFTVRGLIALPDTGLDHAVSRILPVLVIPLILWLRPPDTRHAIDLRIVAVVPFLACFFAWLELQLVLPIQRASLLAGNPLFLSPAMTPLVYLNLFLAMRAKRLPDTVLHYAGGCVALFVIGVQAGSRSSFAVAVGAVILLLIWTVFSWRRGDQGQHVVRHAGAILTVLVIGLFAVVTFGPNTARITQSLLHMGDVIAENVRMQMWIAGAEAIRDQPWFGYGPQNRWTALQAYIAPELFAVNVSHPHNLIITYGVSGGVVGIIVGLAYILVPSIAALFSRRFTADDKVLFALGASTVFTFGLANYVLFEGYMAVVTTLTLIGPYYLLVGAKDNRYHWPTSEPDTALASGKTDHLMPQ